MNKSEITAATVNAINGAFIITLFLLPLRSCVSAPLMVLLAVLFGPCAGLVISSIYPRIEFWVGQRLGSKASLDDLYRIFAWSYLPVGFVSVISWLSIMFLPTKLGKINLVMVAIPSLLILCFCIRNYCSNVITTHQFTARRGTVSLLITLILFFIIPTWIVVLFALIKGFVNEYRSRRCSFDGDGKSIEPRAVKWARIAIIVFYATLFFWIAVYDEKPDPKMIKVVNAPAPDVIRSDNAWLAFLGFLSPTGGPPFIKEEERLRKLKSAIINGDKNTLADDTFTKQQRLSIQGKMPDFYKGKDNGTWEYTLAHYTEIAILLRDNRELLRRYEDLYTYHQYNEPMDYGFLAPMPEFSPIRNMQKLKFIQLTGLAQKGNIKGALVAVQKDAEFWRFIARDSNTLISKLISIALLNSDIRFVAELCVHHQMTTEDWEIVQAILRPFDKGEISMTKALRGEAQISILGIKSSLRVDNKLQKTKFTAFKQNATWNRMYSFHQKGIELSELTPQNFALAVTRKDFERATDPYVKSSFLYNPAGEIIAAVAKVDTSRYIEKGYNLEGVRRLAYLKILSFKGNVPPERMQQFVDKHSGDFGNPYTGAPMKWDSQKKSLFFNPVFEEKPVEIFL